MDKLGLVLEGGGMRGLYTAGVLDFLMDHDIYTDGVPVPVMRVVMLLNNVDVPIAQIQTTCMINVI